MARGPNRRTTRPLHLDDYVELYGTCSTSSVFCVEGSADRQTAAEGGSASVHITDHKDFCVFGPAELGESLAGSEGKLVSWCTKPQNGERQIPEGALTGVTVVKTDQWVQVSGVSVGLPLAKCLAEVTKLIDSGDLTKLNIASHDPGAQLDSAGHKPEGAVVQAGGKTAENWVVRQAQCRRSG